MSERMPEIRLLVDKRGKLHLDMVGYKGDSCAPVLEKLLKTLSEQGIKPEVERIERIGEAPRVGEMERLLK